MRVILFRGKRKDNGEWVEGGYYREDYTDNVYVTFWNSFGLGFMDSCQVAADTVGQYTGLKDKNGKRIFEGDVVQYAERQFGGEDAPVAYPVEFEEGGFCVRYYFLNNWLRNAVDGNIQLEGIEVIGNIHDNPELLEVAHE